MKKMHLSLALCLPLTATLVGCGKKEEPAPPAAEYRENTQPAETPSATATEPTSTPQPAPAPEPVAPPPPAPVPPPPPVAEPERYTVQSGDTLYAIARAHNVDVVELAKWNHLDSPNMLRVGQELVVSAPQP